MCVTLRGQRSDSAGMQKQIIHKHMEVVVELGLLIPSAISQVLSHNKKGKDREATVEFQTLNYFIQSPVLLVAKTKRGSLRLALDSRGETVH